MPRNWQPRPSAEARSLIIGTVRDLLAVDDAAGGWTSGYAVSAAQLRARLGDSLTRNTLRNYLWAMVGSGDLIRVANGLYALPDRRA